MRRSELEHIIRASGDVAQDDEIVVIGSQSILGQFPNAPARLIVSMEADVYPHSNVRDCCADQCLVHGFAGDSAVDANRQRENCYIREIPLHVEFLLLLPGWFVVLSAISSSARDIRCGVAEYQIPGPPAPPVSICDELL